MSPVLHDMICSRTQHLREIFRQKFAVALKRQNCTINFFNQIVCCSIPMSLILNESLRCNAQLHIYGAQKASFVLRFLWPSKTFSKQIFALDTLFFLTKKRSSYYDNKFNAKRLPHPLIASLSSKMTSPDILKANPCFYDIQLY
jgi:hypothetical protein